MTKTDAEKLQDLAELTRRTSYASVLMAWNDPDTSRMLSEVAAEMVKVFKGEYQ